MHFDHVILIRSCTVCVDSPCRWVPEIFCYNKWVPELRSHYSKRELYAKLRRRWKKLVPPTKMAVALGLHIYYNAFSGTKMNYGHDFYILCNRNKKTWSVTDLRYSYSMRTRWISMQMKLGSMHSDDALLEIWYHIPARPSWFR